MTHDSLSHFAPSQTAPEIYASHIFFKPGFSVGRSRLHQWALVCTISGCCTWSNNAGEFTVREGDLIVIRPHTYEAWRVPNSAAARTKRGGIAGRRAEPWETAYGVFHPRAHWLNWLDALEYQSGFAHLHYAGEARAEMQAAVLAMAQVYESGGAYRDLLTLAALEMVLITMLIHNDQESAHDPRVRQAETLMQARYAEPLTMRDVARDVGLSTSHFAYLFVNAMGITPALYLERIRLARATEMLRYTTHSISEISLATGFSCPNYFAYRFRLNLGQSPREYRAANRP